MLRLNDETQPDLIKHVKINEKITHLDMKSIELKRLQKLINKYADTFSRNETDIGCYKNDEGKSEPLDILVKDKTKTLIANPRRIPFAHRPWLENHIHDLMKNKIIEEVTHKNARIWSSPCMIVTKADSDKLRLVVDFRAVNKQIIGESYPLSHIRDILDSLGKSKVFSSLDIRQAFKNIEITKESRRYLGFSYADRQFIYNRLPFGLSISPSVFNRYLNSALRKVDKRVYQKFMDDIFIMSDDFESHLEHIEQVLTAFK